jgi:hypothetical protein
MINLLMYEGSGRKHTVKLFLRIKASRALYLLWTVQLMRLHIAVASGSTTRSAIPDFISRNEDIDPTASPSFTQRIKLINLNADNHHGRRSTTPNSGQIPR